MVRCRHLVRGGCIKILASATTTDSALAKDNHQKKRLKGFCLKPRHNTVVSKAELMNTAIRNVAAHVIGLNVPTLSVLYMMSPAGNSQASPPMGMRNKPTSDDAAFIATSARSDLVQLNPVSQRTKNNSMTRPMPIAHSAMSRPAKNIAGQTMSATIAIMGGGLHLTRARSATAGESGRGGGM